jgi:riboflavin kinase/FMN adenylyltransferase
VTLQSLEASASAQTCTKSVLTIGNFDGVHRGHRMVLREVVSKARSASTYAAAVTFDPHPLEVLRPELAPARLSSIEHRVSMLKSCGVDRVLVLEFTRDVADWDPTEFVRRVLKDQLDVSEVHVGEGFRFGRHARGDVPLMKELGVGNGFRVHAHSLLAGHSSSVVREQIRRGNMDAARQLLARPHRLPVFMVGARAGVAVGRIPPGYALPPQGCYRTVLTAEDGMPRPAATYMDHSGPEPRVRLRVGLKDHEWTGVSDESPAVIDFMGAGDQRARSKG